VTGHPAGAVVAEVGLLCTTARIGIVDPHRRAFTFVNFLAAVVAYENGLTSHVCVSFSEVERGA
jgi:hypothetical protein